MITKKRLIYSRITVGVLTLLLIGVGYYGYDSYLQKEKERDFLEKEKELVLDEIKEINLRYDSTKIESALKKEEILQYKEKIKALEAKIKSDKSSLASFISYRKELNSLKLERDRLFKIADSLKIKNDSLIEERDMAKTQLAQKEGLADKLYKENIKYIEAIKKAAVLKASSFNAHGIRFRSTGSISETERAIRVENIRVSFILEANSFAKKGEKNIYIQILDPKNNIIGDKKSTKFFSGFELDYSSKETIMYTNETLNVSVFVNKGDTKELLTGTYFVNIFHDDTKLGSTDFTLK